MITVLVAQVTVPTLALLDEPPTRFGFQMYSAQGGVEVTATDVHGSRFTPDLTNSLAGSLRPEFDWTRSLPEFVCEVTPRAVGVTVTQPEQKRSVRCD
ncbi:hypothetical protein [Blastococcus saxobsidens]|uniref:Uncharacterized protein n=1 Tax=Blastococcus saxobsidens (strain DD2) TaxID=1146883 RepID=H6RRT5_BLASD|nr:hypothetical protein [Blastococcus saxobsidens]CCG02929.1 protein of unknown function [Blastococcus saxobsidens DD2]